MFYTLKVSNNEDIKTIPASSLMIGELGKVVNKDSIFDEQILLRTYDGIVCLNNPRSTWEGRSRCDIPVTKLKKDEIVILTVIE